MSKPVLLSASKWITGASEPVLVEHRRNTTEFQKTFEIDKLELATLQLTALGVVECYLNGNRVGSDELVPGFTEYDKRLQVYKYDVTSMLEVGKNVISLELSDGWYCGSVGMFRSRDQWGTTPAVRLEFEVGGRVLATDESWVARHTSHFADMMHGETFDFTAEIAAWSQVKVIEGSEAFISVEAEPVKIVRTIEPQSITKTELGFTIDFGENIVGTASMTELGERGNHIKLIYGEALDSKSEVTQLNFKPDMPFIPFPLEAGQVDEVFSGGPGSSFISRHSTKGFRYIRVEGNLTEAEVASIRAEVMHTDLREVGGFASSSEDLNWLEQATRRSFLGNAIEVPTDCPTRERAGWSADWDIFLPTASYMFDVNNFTQKWLRDLAVKQWANGIIGNMAPMPKVEGEGGQMSGSNGSAGWADSIVSIPWSLWEFYGSKSVLQEFWPNMQRWLAYVTEQAETKRHQSRIDRNAEALPHEQYLWDTGFHFGEWFEPGADDVDFPSLFTKDAGPIGTAFYRRTTRQMSQIAALLGETQKSRDLAALSEKIRDAWVTEYLSADGRVTCDTQANLVRALAFDLVYGSQRQVVADQLAEKVRAAGGHLGTGFLATPYLLPTLADNGHADLAFEILFKRDYPSWLNMKDQGATTVWERWEGFDANGNPENSQNHYSKGAVTRFLYEYVAGLRRVPQRTDQIIFQPVIPPSVTWAEAHHNLPKGRVSIHWKIEGDFLVADLEVPADVQAVFIAPDGTHQNVPAGRSSTRMNRK